jgi:hypothetical protein
MEFPCRNSATQPHLGSPSRRKSRKTWVSPVRYTLVLPSLAIDRNIVRVYQKSYDVREG